MRIGLAGGGSDTADHAVAGGGAVVSAAIDLRSRATLSFEAGTDRLTVKDRQTPLDANATALRNAAHAHMVETYGLPPGSYRLDTASDMAPGCGLGSSSSLVVAIVSAYARTFDLALGRRETADAAWQIERQRLGWPGGLQDQFAAAFGGVHLFRFGPGTHVKIEQCDNAELIARLQASLCLFTLELYKAAPITPPLTIRTTTTLRDDALRLWADLSRGGFEALPAIFNTSHQSKSDGITADATTILAELAMIDAVEALKLCGSGPAGVFLVHYGGGLDALKMAAHARGLPGRFMPLVIAPATRDASVARDP